MEVTVRDQVTAKLTVMLVQPLTQLYQITYGHRAREALAQAGAVEVTGARRALQLQVAQAFFGAHGAEEMLQSILQSERQLEAMEQQTRRYLEQGLINKDALLKVQVQREELARSRFAVEKGIRLSHATLNMLMGRPLDAPLSLAPPPPVTMAGTATVSLSALQAQATDARPELVAGRAKVRAAEAAHDATFGKLFPDLNLVGAYNHNAGMGDLMLRNEAFVGLMLSWNVWEWGSTWAESQAAGHRAQEAALRIRAAEEGLQLEVAQRYLDLEEAKKAAAVAEAALALAQENLRLEQNYYAAQQSTATDLLSAETATLRARNDRTVATIQVQLAERALTVATGQDLVELTDTKETH
jgi:outer membrane protein